MGQVGGTGGPVKRIAWVFIAACIAVAIWNGSGATPASFYDNLVQKSDSVREEAEKAGGKINDEVDKAKAKQDARKNGH